MSEEQQRGVVFPVGPDGRRSTAEVGRQVVADALRPVDPVGAAAALLEPLRVTVEQGVRGDRREQGTDVGREQRPVAAQHPQVEETQA